MHDKRSSQTGGDERVGTDEVRAGRGMLRRAHRTGGAASVGGNLNQSFGTSRCVIQTILDRDLVGNM